GASALVLGIKSKRICGLEQAAISASDSKDCLSGNSMFDCPLQTQTSPTRTLANSILFLPWTMSVSGPPAFRCDSLTIHLPPLALVLASCPRNLTVTSSPSSAQPQTGTRIPC